MRYAFVSDIHANLQAWEAVLQDLIEHNVDCVICLGDIVGYGPRPAEVLGAVADCADYCLLGNHDAAVCGRMDASLFSGEAERVVRWTSSQLGRATRRLSPLPYLVAGEGFAAVHANAGHPSSFEYLSDEATARASWSALTEPLVFVGHTHVPEIHALAPDQAYACYLPGELRLEAGWRYIVNVGSVGLPRDDDPRASYCLFDDEVGTVDCRRVAFDIPGFVNDVQRILGASEQADYLVSHYRQAITNGTVAPPADGAAIPEAVIRRSARLEDNFAPDQAAPRAAPTVLRVPRVRRRGRLRAPSRPPAWHPYTPLPETEADASATPERRQRRRWIAAAGIALGLGLGLAALALAWRGRHRPTPSPAAVTAVRRPAPPRERAEHTGFGTAFDPSSGDAVTLKAGNYAGVPLTVECWVRLHRHEAFNVLVACGAKTEDGHWELYTAAGSGAFGVYRRGLEPSRIQSNAAVCDGNWHYLAMVHEPGLIRLFVDGALVMTSPVAGTVRANRHLLAVGSLLNGDYAADGMIDELRISRAMRETRSVPQRPFAADRRASGLWHFDQRGSASQYRDDGTGRNPLILKTESAAPPAANTP